MIEVFPSTTNEEKLIKGIQKSIGSLEDGIIGTQTLSDIACILKSIDKPITLKIYDMPVIISKNLVPFMPKGKKLSGWNNTINGSFLSGKTPCSILIADGWVYYGASCHSYYNKPETVLYRLFNGTVGIKRAKSAVELPNGVKWAIGGLGLLDFYNPEAEGFCKCTDGYKTEDFSDVLRRTNHSMIGYKNGYFYQVLCLNKSAKEVNEAAELLGLKYAIMLDGGHLAAINGTEDFAKINSNCAQYYAVQGE